MHLEVKTPFEKPLLLLLQIKGLDEKNNVKTNQTREGIIFSTRGNHFKALRAKPSASISYVIFPFVTNFEKL